MSEAFRPRKSDTMSKATNKALEKIKENAPTAQAWGRALVAAIPVVGGSLDHLLFDKADEIRFQKLEQSVKNIEEFINKLDEGRIAIQWFESVEALEMFKQLYEKVEFEPSDSKVKTLSQVYTLFGTKEHVADPNKKAMLETISKLTNKQRDIFRAVGEVPEETKTGSSDAISYTGRAIWQSSVLKYINRNAKYLVLLKGVTSQVRLDVELDILTSFNLLRIIDIPNLNDRGYAITSYGKLALSYLRDAS